MLYKNYAALVIKLKNIIKQYGNNVKVNSIVKDEFNKRNWKESQATRLLTEKVSLETLDIENERINWNFKK